MNAPTPDFRTMTSDTIGRDLLQALVQELKLLPKPWAALSKSKQDDVIDRLRERVDVNIKMAVHMLAAQGRTVVAGDLEQITIKDGAKAVVKFSLAAPSLHQLYEAAGKAVLVVVAGAEDHTAGMDEVRGESDQRAMDLGTEYAPDGAGNGMDDSDVVDAEYTPLEHQPLESELNKAFDDGYQAASEGELESDCPRLAGALCIQWVKGWKAWHEDHASTDTEADPS
jgi:ribosome modulation factor